MKLSDFIESRKTINGIEYLSLMLEVRGQCLLYPDCAVDQKKHLAEMMLQGINRKIISDMRDLLDRLRTSCNDKSVIDLALNIYNSMTRLEEG